MLPPLNLDPLRGNVVRTFVEICAETVAALARNQQDRAALNMAMFGQKKKSRRAQTRRTIDVELPSSIGGSSYDSIDLGNGA